MKALKTNIETIFLRYLNFLKNLNYCICYEFENMAIVFLPDTLLSFSVVVPAFSMDSATFKSLFVPGPETIHIGPYPHCGHDSLSPAHESIEGLLIPF